jgi:hypothetical protein
MKYIKDFINLNIDAFTQKSYKNVFSKYRLIIF